MVREVASRSHRAPDQRSIKVGGGEGTGEPVRRITRANITDVIEGPIEHAER